MRKIGFLIATLGTVFVPLLATAPAHAQATRTWVSGVGDDVNPCSRTAPCKTFAGAISKTAAGGEISVLDPGGFGAVTITKSMTLNGDGTLASILNAGGVNGVVVNAGAGGKVILRALSINGSIGATPGLNAIRFLSGTELTVDKCSIYGQSNAGIDVALGATGYLNIVDTSIDQAPTGINVTATAGLAVGSIQTTTIKGSTTNGLSVGNNAFVSMNNSAITAGIAGNAVNATGTGTINVTNSEVTNFPVAFNTAAGSNIRIMNNNIYDNTANFVLGGTIASDGTNRVVGGGATNPNGVAIGHK